MLRTLCVVKALNIDGFNLNGMEKYKCKVSSPKIDAAMPNNQNLSHFPSFAMCSTNALQNSIVIFSLSLSGPMYHYMVLAADRDFLKICS